MPVFVELVRDSILSLIVHLAPRVANVLVFIIISRLAGPSQAGVFALATTYLIILTTLMRGLDDLVVREVSREPGKAAIYLTNFLSVRLALSFLLYLALWMTSRFALNYPESTTQMVLVIGLSVIPDSLTYVAQSVLLGQRRFLTPAVAMFLGTVFKIVCCGLIVSRGGNPLLVAWYWFLGSLLALAVQLIFVVHSIKGLQMTGKLNWRPLLSSMVPFFLITVTTTMESQVDILLLSIYRTNTEVGWYNAATTVAFSLIMIAQAYRMSIYPLMTRYALQAPEKLKKIYEQSLRILGMLSLPMATGIILLASPIVTLIYGEQFGPTAQILHVLTIVLFFLFLNVPSSRMMLVYDRQGRSLIILFTSMVVNILVNLLLIPRWGTMGAAWARFSSGVVEWLLIYSYVEHYLIRSNLLRLLFKPILATLFMASFVWVFRFQPLFVSIPMGIIIYTGSLWLLGGISSADVALIQQLIPINKSK
jgi:O-antigen/teichoic acid export membrane protein